MKTILCLLAVAAVCLARPGQYTDKYDNINIDEILGNPRLLVPYLECMTNDAARCSPEGKELRSHIKDALETNCEHCTKWQRESTRKVIRHIINNEKDYWEKLCAKYDPQRKFVGIYEKELREIAG